MTTDFKSFVHELLPETKKDSSKYLSDSEANSSDSLENREEMFQYYSNSDVCSIIVMSVVV